MRAIVPEDLTLCWGFTCPWMRDSWLCPIPQPQVTPPPPLACPSCLLRSLDSTLELTEATERFQAGSKMANLCLTKIPMGPERARTETGRPLRGKWTVLARDTEVWSRAVVVGTRKDQAREWMRKWNLFLTPGKTTVNQWYHLYPPKQTDPSLVLAIESCVRFSTH